SPATIGTALRTSCRFNFRPDCDPARQPAVPPLQAEIAANSKNCLSGVAPQYDQTKVKHQPRLVARPRASLAVRARRRGRWAFLKRLRLEAICAPKGRAPAEPWIEALPGRLHPDPPPPAPPP